MTNEQIIANIAMTICDEDAVLQMLEDDIEIPLHIVQGWAARGPYRVKKNEHGLECRLWKKRLPPQKKPKLIHPKMNQQIEISICVSLSYSEQTK